MDYFQRSQGIIADRNRRFCNEYSKRWQVVPLLPQKSSQNPQVYYGRSICMCIYMVREEGSVCLQEAPQLQVDIKDDNAPSVFLDNTTQ